MFKPVIQSLKYNVNSFIKNQRIDRSDMTENNCVSREHSDQEECDHVSIHETVSDEDNVTASDHSDDDSETERGDEAKNGQIWNKLPAVVSCCRKRDIVVGKPGLTAYSENISSVADTLKLFITDYILNEICHHTNVEGSSQIPNLWKDTSSEELLALLGL